MDVWPTLPPAACESQLRDLSQAWQTYLADLRPESLDQQVHYTNSKGESWSNNVADVLTHVVLHSSYHRCQIASFLGRAGHAPTYSDYIECIRRGHLDRGVAGLMESRRAATRAAGVHHARARDYLKTRYPTSQVRIFRGRRSSSLNSRDCAQVPLNQ
jgi:hypothetical protein